MKLRVSLLLFSTLLLLGSRAHAGAPVTLAQLPFCVENPAQPQAVAPALPTFIPGAAPASLPHPMCGVCSPSVCVGLYVNSGCGLSGINLLYCRDSGNTCSQDGSVRCTCTSGPGGQ